jgi:hypothetical protein
MAIQTAFNLMGGTVLMEYYNKLNDCHLLKNSTRQPLYVAQTALKRLFLRKYVLTYSHKAWIKTSGTFKRNTLIN